MRKCTWSVVVAMLVLMPLLAACGGSPPTTTTTPTTTTPTTTTPTPTATTPLIITAHEITGEFYYCLRCHENGTEGAGKNPADHIEFTDDTCLTCHKPSLGPIGRIGQDIPHMYYWGYEECLECHESGGFYLPDPLGESPAVWLDPMPSSHIGLTSAVCITCHFPPT